ncbi:MAG: hypothetical protein ACREEP_11020 [Dongiaceae bacterium]
MKIDFRRGVCRKEMKATLYIVCALVIAAALVVARSATAEDARDGAESSADSDDQAVSSAIAAAAAIESNESSEPNAPHDPWCWTKAGKRDAALAQIAETQAKHGNVDNVIAAAALIDNDNVRTETLADLVKLQAAEFAPEGMQYIMNAAEMAANLIDDDSCRDVTLSKLAEAQEVAGRVDAALLTTKSIANDTMRNITEYFVATAQVAKGNYAIVDDMESPLAIVMVLSEAAIKQAEAGQMAAARHAVADARRIGEDMMSSLLAAGMPGGLMESVERMLPFNLLMKAQARLGDVAGVKQAADNLTDVVEAAYGVYTGEDGSGEKVETLEVIAEAYAWAGDESNAVATANEVDDAGRRGRLLTKISEILQQ